MSVIRLRDRGTRLAIRDRLWAGVGITVVVGPLELPSLEDLRAGAVEIARTLPGLHLMQRLDREHMRWVDAARVPEAFASDAVMWDSEASSAVSDGKGIGEHLERVQSLRSELLPVQWVVSPGRLTTMLDHAVGDGHTTVVLPRLLLDTAQRGSVPEWFSRESEPHPFARALRQHYGARPARALATLKEVHPSRPVTAAGSSRSFAPKPAVAYGVCPKETWREVKEWRRRCAHGSSMTALQAALVRGALGAAGTAPRGGPTILVDGRRYLEPGTDVRGNFVVGLEVATDDDWEPMRTSERLQRALDAGRPLSAMAFAFALQQAIGWREALTAKDRPRPADLECPDDPRPVLAITSMQSPHLDRLPWVGEQRLVGAMMTPAPAEGITAACVEVRSALHVSMSYFPAVFPRGQVEDAIARLTTSPLELLAPFDPCAREDER